MADTSASDQFSVRWDHFAKNLTSSFLSHLSNNDLVDVTLAVEGKLFQAHKLVLSVCSPYFKNIFKVNPCQHPVVILKDMGYTEVESLLKFMYQGEVNVRQDNLATFIKVAQILQIKGLTGEGSKCEPHDHDSLSGDRSDLPPPLENMEADACLNEDKTRNCSDSNSSLNRTKVVDKAKSKRPPEATVSKSPTNKRCRTSPPPLNEMDIPTTTLENVITKLEPLDFDLQSNEFSLAEDPLDNSSISKHGLRQDAVNYLKDDQSFNADQQQQSSNSLTNLSCSQGDITQENIRGSEYPRLRLGGYIYCMTHKIREKLYWRCRLYRKRKCNARTITAAGIILKKTHTHNHEPEIRDASALYLNSGKFIRRTARNLMMTAASSCGV